MASILRRCGISISCVLLGALIGFLIAVAFKPNHTKLIFMPSRNAVYLAPDKGDLIYWYIREDDNSIIIPSDKRLSINFDAGSMCEQPPSGKISFVCLVNGSKNLTYYECQDLTLGANCDPGADPNSTTESHFEFLKLEFKRTFWKIFSIFHLTKAPDKDYVLSQSGIVAATPSNETIGTSSAPIAILTSHAPIHWTVSCDANNSNKPGMFTKDPAQGGIAITKDTSIANGTRIDLFSNPYGYDLSFVGPDGKPVPVNTVCKSNNPIGSGGTQSCVLNLTGTLPAVVSYTLSTHGPACPDPSTDPMKPLQFRVE